MPDVETVEASYRAHLPHMTDGRWHDDCDMCRRRRVYGGTGTHESLRAGDWYRKLFVASAPPVPADPGEEAAR